MADLTAFQIECLAVLKRDGEVHGLAIKQALEDEFEKYDREVNHGRLYPNLDEMVADGLIEKGSLDKRTNSYELTDAGENVLTRRVTVLNGEF